MINFMLCQEDRIFIFKPYITPERDCGVTIDEFRQKPSFDEPFLNIDRCALNVSNKIETIIFIDSNILINMRNVIDKTISFEASGMSELVERLNKLPNYNLSPGFAYSEIPEDRINSDNEKFNTFIDEYLPGASRQEEFINRENKYIIKTFDNADLMDQDHLALPYAAMLHLQIVARKHYKSTPIEKFREYLRRLENYVNCITGKEIIIAQYCFSPENIKLKPSYISDDTWNKFHERKRSFIRNFLAPRTPKDILEKRIRRPGNFNSAKKVALNAAFDLCKINKCIGFTKTDFAHEYWLCSQDQKFFEFSKSFKFIESSEAFLFDYCNYCNSADFWVQTSLMFNEKLKSRSQAGYNLESMSVETIQSKIPKAESELKEVFENI